MTQLLMKKAYNQAMNGYDTEMILKNVISIFEQKAKVTETDIDIIATTFGVSHDLVEQQVFDLLSSFFHSGRHHANPTQVDEEELAMGIEVEYEHTTNLHIATRIALDHLSEIPDYYTRLAIMENK